MAPAARRACSRPRSSRRSGSHGQGGRPQQHQHFSAWNGKVHAAQRLDQRFAGFVGLAQRHSPKGEVCGFPLDSGSGHHDRLQPQGRQRVRQLPPWKVVTGAAAPSLARDQSTMKVLRRNEWHSAGVPQIAPTRAGLGAENATPRFPATCFQVLRLCSDHPHAKGF